jgi:hypothetical protein
MPVLNEIAAQLATLGLGTVGTTIHIGMMPETPDVCCAVYEYGGPPSDLGFGVSGVQHETPGVQVVFRGSPGDYATPRTSAGTAHNGLAAVQGTTLSGTAYLTIRPVQSPFPLKRDANDRVYIACNYLANKEPS